MLKSVTVQSLNDQWLLAIDPSNIGKKESWFNSTHADAKPAQVPGIIQQVFPTYNGLVWYYNEFRPIRKPTNGERALLHFGRAEYMVQIWLNGRYVGEHEGGEGEFEFDVTTALTTDGDNLLAVRLLNPTDEAIDGITLAETPCGNKIDTDYRPGAHVNYGGITRPVELRLLPDVRIVDVFAKPRVETGVISVEIAVQNDTDRALDARIDGTVTPHGGGLVLAGSTTTATVAPGVSAHQVELTIDQPRLWDLDDPYLYRVNINLKTNELYEHAYAVRCGFRDFRVIDGYFHLNGKRLFLKSTHTGNHFPIGQIVPQNPDLYRRDLLYAKANGFNAVRYIAVSAYPEQLDYCDEIGLMVYEENYAAWRLDDSPRMKELYDLSTREVILRDRNHPCITVWGLLNETPDGPVFRHAHSALKMVRELDETRLVLLGSGRWDCDLGIGSVSNPGGTEWEHQWGGEKPGGGKVSNEWNSVHGGYFEEAGDAHVYPAFPIPPDSVDFLRTLGHDTMPVFLSEFGVGSMLNVVDELRKYDEVGAGKNLLDVVLFRSIREKLAADWRRFGMEGLYPFLEDFLRDSYKMQTKQRRLVFDIVRSNPNYVGFSITGMLDHGMSGEGLWTFWREWKPELADMLRDGWAPLRWCLFVENRHHYAGRPIRLEATLANEDILAPGDYPVTFRIFCPNGVVWERRTKAHIPTPQTGKKLPFAFAVLDEEIVLDTPGEYTLAAHLETGGAPHGDRVKFRLSDDKELPEIAGQVHHWGIDQHHVKWLEEHGIQCREFGHSAVDSPGVILVGLRENATAADWKELMTTVAKGSKVVFLDSKVFKKDDDLVYRLPLENKGHCYEFSDWLYHKESVAGNHKLFDGLPKGIMDPYFYDQILSHMIYNGLDEPDEVAAAAFAVGYVCPGGYASGVLAASYRFGSGGMIINALNILRNVDKNPAADRLLLNIIDWAREGLDDRPTEISQESLDLINRLYYE